MLTELSEYGKQVGDLGTVLVFLVNTRLKMREVSSEGGTEIPPFYTYPFFRLPHESNLKNSSVGMLNVHTFILYVSLLVMTFFVLILFYFEQIFFLGQKLF